MNLELLGDALLILWAAPVIATPFEFLGVRDEDGRRFAFRQTRLGLLLMAHMLALAALAALGLCALFLDGGGGGAWRAARIIAFLILMVVSWWWWWTVRRSRLASAADPTRPSGPLDPRA